MDGEFGWCSDYKRHRDVVRAIIRDLTGYLLDVANITIAGPAPPEGVPLDNHPPTRQEKRVAAREQRRAAQRAATLAAKTAVAKPSRGEAINTVVWGIGFPLLLFFVALGAGTAFAMTSSESAGFWVAKVCFSAAAFDVVAMTIYWVAASRQPMPWNLILPTIAAIVVVPGLVLSIQWLSKIETQLSTHLIPGNQPTPPIPGRQDRSEAMIKAINDSLKIFYGTNASLVMPNTASPHTVLSMAGEKLIQLERGKGGDLIITVLKIFDDRNNIIARVDSEDGFWVENSTRKKRPDDSTLVVYDHSDQEVLRLVFLNPGAVSVTGIFRHPRVRMPIIITSKYMEVNGTRITNTTLGAGNTDIRVEADK
jgi:hypothetical protein